LERDRKKIAKQIGQNANEMSVAGCWGLTPVIPATQEAETREIAVQS
jgi:hypothetical protein